MLTSTDTAGITDYPMVQFLGNELAFMRTVSRNMPFIELTNDAESASAITEFRMTIGDTRFHFGDGFLGTFALIGTTTPGYDLVSSVVGNGDELVVEIPNGGLLPGDLVRFKVDIDVDPEYAGIIFDYPDYRTVFFDMNGIDVYGDDPNQPGADDNSTVKVTFATTADDDVAEATFTDPTVTGPQATNYNILGGCCCCCGGSTPLDLPFQLYGEITVVPEPASLVLCLAGAVAGLGVCRRYRGSRASR